MNEIKNNDKKENIELSTNGSSNIVIITENDYVSDEELDQVIEKIKRESVIFDMANYVSDEIPMEELVRIIEESTKFNKSTTLKGNNNENEKLSKKMFKITKLFQNNNHQTPLKIFIKPIRDGEIKHYSN